MKTIKHFLEFNDLSIIELEYIYAKTKELKNSCRENLNQHTLKDKTLVLIFEKQSTRTRLSFEAGMQQLGGNTVYLNNTDSQLGRGESVEDTARVISSMCDLVVLRTFQHSTIEKYADNSTVPVINGLTNQHHPCQILADIFTFEEYRGPIKGKKIAWVGDPNNVCRSWMQAAPILNFDFCISSPPACEIKLKNNLDFSQSKCVEFFSTPEDAVKNADLVVTDVWVSMGFEQNALSQKEMFKKWQVNQELMNLALPEALFMHCLPAHRGEEVTKSVIEGPNSVVWTEAENRLHTQKALLEMMLLGRLS